ncbi:MAG: hypothetical protein ACK4QP_01295 [Pseudorhizobium sp.]
MRKFGLSFVVLAAANPLSPVQSQTRLPYEKAPYNDTVIHCGALFWLLASAYEEAGDTSKSRTYREKFGKQLRTSELEFLSVGRPKQEAQELYEERRGTMVAIYEKNTENLVSLVRFCDRKYPL